MNETNRHVLPVSLGTDAPCNPFASMVLAIQAPIAIIPAQRPQESTDNALLWVILITIGVVCLVLIGHFRHEANRLRLRKSAIRSAWITGGLCAIPFAFSFLNGQTPALLSWVDENLGGVTAGLAAVYAVWLIGLYVHGQLPVSASGNHSAHVVVTQMAVPPEVSASPELATVSPLKRHCPHCRGTGEEEVPCPSCAGGGERMCTYVGEDRIMFIKFPVPCKAGHLYYAHGSYPCPRCNGRGFHACYQCNGRRDIRQKCGKCGATGLI